MKLEHFPTNETSKKMMGMLTGNGFYDNSYVAKWLFQVLGIEMEEARELIENLAYQVFPDTATWGIGYHEQKYGIRSDSESLEERRRNILRIRNFRAPMNPERIRTIAEAATERKVEVTEFTGPFQFEVKVIIDDSKADFKEALMRADLDRAKPSHLRYHVTTERPFNNEIFAGCYLQQAEILYIGQVNE